MKSSIIFRLCAFLLLSTNCALLLSVLFNADWIVRQTLLGTSHEGLLWYVSSTGSTSIDRGWVFDIFVVGSLTTAVVDGCLLIIAVLMLFILKKQKRLSKFIKRTCLIPGFMILLGMSVYTGHYTWDIPTEMRGWCFWVAWFCFPCSLTAVIFEICYQIEQEEEEDIVTPDIPS